MPKTSGKPKSEYAIQTVSNALRMLEVFHTESEMGVSDLARVLGLHKNNAFRLLATLELAGYMQQDPTTELYHLGPRCLELGHAFARSHTLMDRARPILEALAEEAGETTHLGILRGVEVVHLDGVQPDQLVLTGLRVGKRLDAHCTALGKILLAGALAGEFGNRSPGRAAADDSESAPSTFTSRPTSRPTSKPASGIVSTESLLTDSPLAAHTAATLVDTTKLIEELRAVQLRGYATDTEEFASGLHCVAAPVRDASSRVVAAISLSGPSMRLDEGSLHGDAARKVSEAADRLSCELGWAVGH